MKVKLLVKKDGPYKSNAKFPIVDMDRRLFRLMNKEFQAAQ